MGINQGLKKNCLKVQGSVCCVKGMFLLF